jgi:SAM-dependent methyltransferase
MASLAGTFDEELLADPAFAGVGTLVDVGGGDGSLLLALLRRRPAMRGVVFDLPHVVDAARTRIAEAGLAGRCSVVAGDAFDSVPRGDAHLLCRVLHDWNDERARALVESCGRAGAPDGRLFVIERLLPQRFDTSRAARAAAFADLATMVMTGGRERRADEFAELLASAGFRMLRARPSASGLALIEAAAVNR